MKSRGLTAAAFVLAVLGATLYWSNIRKPAEDAAKIAADAPLNILSLNPDDLSKIEIKKKGGDNVVLSKSAPDTWRITSPKPLNVDLDAIAPVVAALSSVDADHVIEEKAGDVKQFGLAEPVLEVSATTKDGKTQQLLIGDETPTGDAAYAMLSGNPRVFTVLGFTKTSLDKGTKELRDKRLLPVDFNKITRVELDSPRLGISFGSDNGQWTIQNPKEMRADTSELEAVVDKLKAATLDVNASDADLKKAAAAFSFGTPVATVKATDESGLQEMQVRRNNGEFYAKASAVEGVYKVPIDLGAELEKKLDDFRNKNLFDFGSNNPDKIEMHDGAKTVSLTRNGDDWFSDGKKMDGPGVDVFVDKIRNLAATKFVTSGFAKPTTDLTVTSDDGKRVEKVLIAKDGDGYVAKRENEGPLYGLDAKGFDELQESANQIKPAEAAKN